MKSYLLIRVFLDVEEECWFGQSLKKPVREFWEEGKEPAAQEAGKDFGAMRMEHQKHIRRNPAAHKEGGSLWFRLCHPIKTRRQRAEYLDRLQRECELRLERMIAYSRAMEAWQEQMDKSREEVCGLTEEILELARGCNEISAVYEDSLKKALGGISGRRLPRVTGESVIAQEQRENSGLGKDSQASLWDIWQQNFPIQEFSGFGKEFWNLHLLPERLPHHFVVLGAGGDVFSLLEHCAREMRSLRWFLLKGNCTARLMEFVDAFYDEYGLVIELHVFEEAREMQREGLRCPERACILDFTGGIYLSGADVARGSIWLDIYASEEKQQKLESRCPQITYYSLKEKWRKAQKRCNCAVFP